MPKLDISGAVASDLKNTMIDYSVDPVDTDGALDQKETSWQMTDWTINLGYYKNIPEYKVAIDTKATWVIGGGYEAEPEIKMQLNAITGNGKDSFNSILKNQYKVSKLAGDSFAEIITHNGKIISEGGVLINLKPLNPSKIIVFQNQFGRIIRYEQTTDKKFMFIFKRKNKKYKSEEIFHLSNERIADEMHGISTAESVKWIIDARNEAMVDMRTLMHRHVKPIKVFKLATDDKEEIAAFKAKQDAAHKDGENMYIPMETVEVDPFGIAPNQTLNPLPWIANLTDYFYQAVNVPQIIIGNAKEFTDASGKIVYLSYEQSVKGEQLYVEEQMLGQLNIVIKLTFPASLQNDAISNTPAMELENEPMEPAAQPNDTTEELEGKT